jgi:transposase InsO family protein
MFYYNNQRLQEKIKELAPIQFRKQVLSALFI